MSAGGPPTEPPSIWTASIPKVYANRWKTLAVLCASLVIVIVGNTVLNVALPTLQQPESAGGLGATNTAIQWIVDAYGLVFAGLLFTAAALGDRFGRKGALQAGLLIFGAGSALGALADSSAMLIAARAIMGVGAAFVMPSTLSILSNVFPARERAKAIAIWAGISGSGAAVGPVASGFLLEHFWWGSVFLINLPIIAAAIVAGYLLVPKSKDSTESPLDPVGALLSIVGLGALVYAIIEGPHHGWISGESALWFGAAAVFLIGFGFWEWNNRHPMLDLRLFQNPRFAVSSGGITLVFFAMFGSFFMLAQYLQGVVGYTPLGAAVRLLPFSAVMMVDRAEHAQARRSPRCQPTGCDRSRSGRSRDARGVDVRRRHAVLAARHHVLHPRRRNGAHDDADDHAAHGGRPSGPRGHGFGDERHDP